MKIADITEAFVDREEAERNTSDIEPTKFIAALKENCSDALSGMKNNMGYIFKGIPGMKKEFFLYDSSTVERTSANTNNFYTLFMSKYSPEWAKLPPRNKSVICSSSYEMARGYGTPFQIFPFNGTKIGVCPEDDLWMSFGKSGIKDLSDFNDQMAVLMTRIFANRDTFSYFDVKKINVVIANNIEQFLKMTIDSETMPKMPQWFTPFIGKTVGEAVNALLSPKYFKLLNTRSYFSEIIENKEVWFSGKCIIVRQDLIQKYFQ